MNRSDTIQFITKSRGLLLDGKFVLKTWICLPVMVFMIYFFGDWQGTLMRAVSLLVILLLLALNLCYFFCPDRKKSLKHRLLIRPVACANIVLPLFYACVIAFYDRFGVINLILLFILPIAVLTALFYLFGRKKACKKTKAQGALAASVTVATTFFVVRGLNSLMSENLSDMAHFIIIAVSMILVSGLICAIVILDLQRYYYFTKLEKAGLVTEEILKPDE